MRKIIWEDFPQGQYTEAVTHWEASLHLNLSKLRMCKAFMWYLFKWMEKSWKANKSWVLN